MVDVIDRIKLIGEPVIRPSTLTKFTKLKAHTHFDHLELYDVIRTCVEKGIDLGLKGDMIFIIYLFIYDLTLKGVEVHTFIDTDLSKLPIHGFYRNIDKLYDKITKMISLEEPTFVKYCKEDEVTFADIIYNIIGCRYDETKYSSYGEAKLYHDTYAYNFEDFYLNILEFENYLLLQKGAVINNVTKKDIEKYKKNYGKTVFNNRVASSNKTKYLVTFKSESKFAVAMLLSNKYNCPCVQDIGQDLSLYDDIISADEL